MHHNVDLTHVGAVMVGTNDSTVLSLSVSVGAH